MPQALGLVVGTVLVVDVFTGLISGYLALAVPLVVLTLPFVLLHPRLPAGRPSTASRSPGGSWGARTGSAPGEYPDFAWAWFTRFLVSLAIAMGTLYLLYFLRDQIHYARLFPGQTRVGRAADPDRDLHGRRGAHRDRRRDDLRPDRPQEDDRHGLRHR